MSYRKRYQAQIEQWKEGKLVGILTNIADGVSGICIQPHMVAFMNTVNPSWVPKKYAEERIDQELIKAVLEHPKKFLVRRKKGAIYSYSSGDDEFIERPELYVKFVDPIVVQAKAWRLNSHDGSESVSVQPECIALWKIRQRTDDPDILKLATLEEGKYWFIGETVE